MAFARTILALLIALSVASLPVAGAAAFKLKSQEMTEMSAFEPMDDCCPPAADPCKSMRGCGSMAACMVNCLSYSGGMSSPLVYPVTLAALMPLFESGILHSQTSCPPFRPPRV
jgi:hypothetical protein